MTERKILQVENILASESGEIPIYLHSNSVKATIIGEKKKIGRTTKEERIVQAIV